METSVFVIFCFAAIIVMIESDGKVIIALSSVCHISITPALYVSAMYVGLTHIIVSPFIFISVYVTYKYLGNRLGWAMVPLVILLNLGFPLIGGFWGEVIVSGLIVVIFSVGYIIIFIFHYRLYVKNGNSRLNELFVVVIVTVMLVIV